jgi:3-dehydroquinate dehydratase
MHALRDAVIAFKKPVAYVHGDSHYFRWGWRQNCIAAAAAMCTAGAFLVLLQWHLLLLLAPFMLLLLLLLLAPKH